MIKRFMEWCKMKWRGERRIHLNAKTGRIYERKEDAPQCIQITPKLTTEIKVIRAEEIDNG